MSSVIPLIRFGVFGFLIVCSLVELGLAGHFISLDGRSVAADGMPLAVGVITLVTIIPALVISLIRRGAFTTMVVVELAFSGVLWVLWLASAGVITNSESGLPTDCSTLKLVRFVGLTAVMDNTLVTLCRQIQALEAFAWLGWIALTIYFGTLLVFSIIATTNGNNNIWMQSVVDADFMARPKGPGTVPQPAMAQQPQYPPQQQLYTQPGAQQPQLYTQPGAQAPQFTGNSTFQNPGLVGAQPTGGSIHV